MLLNLNSSLRKIISPMTCNQCSTEIKSFWIINNYLFNYNLCVTHLSNLIRKDIQRHPLALKTDLRYCITCGVIMGRNKSLKHKVIRCANCVNGNGNYATRDLC